MSDRMRPVPFRELVLRMLAEYRARGSIFDIPREHFWRPGRPASAPLLSSEAANPVGPAAGPHTQLAQNIVAAWLCGGRYIELKTVQKLDTLEVAKPCIDAADEGWNVEWSTELTLGQAYDEYLKAWLVVHLLPHVLPELSGGSATLFNMSVGYDLAGIRSEPMDRFIDGLVDATREPVFARYRQELDDLGEAPGLAAEIPPRVCRSVTLSTMHGCPPPEIESICDYLLASKKLDTLVKLNPTLLGYEKAREILSGSGWEAVRLSAEGFAKDLQPSDAIPMLSRLRGRARAEGRFFGAKLSNTLAAANHKGVLPGEEMYMSGRALHPLTMELAAWLAAETEGGLPISYCGGAAAWNVGAILDAGVRPVTVATELLKPGGYARLKQLAETAEEHAASWGLARIDPAALRAAADRARSEPRTRRDTRGDSKAGVGKPLPLFDCFVAPCVEACPIHQDVPEYIHLSGAGRHAEAFDAVLRANPLPFMTGSLCDQACALVCSRMDWEGAVRIREMKRVSAWCGRPVLDPAALLARAAARRGVKVAVIGAGPAGMAAASLLAREGFEAHVFERQAEPGGIVRHVVPGFRIPAAAVENDVALARTMGVVFHLGEGGPLAPAALKESGFRYVLAAVGAEAGRGIGVPGAMDALSFLRRLRRDPRSVKPGKRVAVVGGGDTAMDAARTAARCAGVKSVAVIYRRSEREMPASVEEYRAARDEGIAFHFLRAPVRWSRKEGLVCTVMELGAADTSGRRAPVATGATESIPADMVVAAVGAAVDDGALAALGLPDARTNPETHETSMPGVFLIGDAALGPATIVRAIASARRAVNAICAREGGSTAPAWGLPPEDAAALRAARDRLVPASEPGASDAEVARVESRRCLGCRALCLKCVEVCPNRANTAVRVPGLRDELQIVHQDALCNECGDCATFCPWDGKPYRDKLTVFRLAADFEESTNPGFFLLGERGVLRLQGRRVELFVDASGRARADGADPGALAVVEAIVGQSRWLLGGMP